MATSTLRVSSADSSTFLFLQSQNFQISKTQFKIQSKTTRFATVALLTLRCCVRRKTSSMARRAVATGARVEETRCLPCASAPVSPLPPRAWRQRWRPHSTTRGRPPPPALRCPTSRRRRAPLGQGTPHAALEAEILRMAHLLLCGPDADGLGGALAPTTSTSDLPPTDESADASRSAASSSFRLVRAAASFPASPSGRGAGDQNS